MADLCLWDFLSLTNKTCHQNKSSDLENDGDADSEPDDSLESPVASTSHVDDQLTTLSFTDGVSTPRTSQQFDFDRQHPNA